MDEIILCESVKSCLSAITLVVIVDWATTNTEPGHYCLDSVVIGDVQWNRNWQPNPSMDLDDQLLAADFFQWTLHSLLALGDDRLTSDEEYEKIKAIFNL